MDATDAATRFAAAISETLNTSACLFRAGSEADSATSHERCERVQVAVQGMLALLREVSESNLQSSVKLDELRRHSESVLGALNAWDKRPPLPQPLVEALRDMVISLGIMSWQEFASVAHSGK